MMQRLQNGMLSLTKKIILVFGVILTLFGFTALAAELWRTWTGLNSQIRYNYLGLAAVLMGAGLALIQTQDPLRLIRLWEEWRISRLPGGQRFTDPPPETAPTMLPRERWRQVDPSWRDPHSRTRRDD